MIDLNQLYFILFVIEPTTTITDFLTVFEEIYYCSNMNIYDILIIIKQFLCMMIF